MQLGAVLLVALMEGLRLLAALLLRLLDLAALLVERRGLGPGNCLLYTSDAADDLLCVDLGGRRIFKKKNTAAE